MLRLLANIALFQLGWFVCIWQGGIAAVLVTIVVLILHFCFLVKRESYRVEAVLLIKVLAVGFVVETIAIQAGALEPIIGHDNLAFSAQLPPIWLLCLWVLFATTLLHGLLWLREKLLLCSIVAAVSAPSSYYAGSLLSPYMALGESLIFSLAVIGLLWAAALPLIMRFFVNRPESL